MRLNDKTNIKKCTLGNIARKNAVLEEKSSYTKQTATEIENMKIAGCLKLYLTTILMSSIAVFYRPLLSANKILTNTVLHQHCLSKKK
jgi:hypothetical protein